MINKDVVRGIDVPNYSNSFREQSAMIFINNKYTGWYYSIVNSAMLRDNMGYTERHHIIPKSLGGPDDLSNLIRLTAREHFICHQLLTKMTVGLERIKMLHALGMFVQVNRFQQRILTARQYDIARKSISDARRGTKRPGIGGVKKGNIPWNKGVVQGRHSDESNFSRSLTMKNKPVLECPHCSKIGKGNVMHRFHFENCKKKPFSLEKLSY